MPLDLEDFSAFVGFGDSTVDSRNAATATFGAVTPESQGYYQGRFSTGPNYFDQLWAGTTGDEPEAFGVWLDIFGNAGDGGANYAFGGSVSDDLAGQLANFASDLGSDRVLTEAPISDTLFGINIGGNDLLAFAAADGLAYTGAQLQNLAQEVASDVGLMIDGLAALGARSVLLSGVPNVGVTPDVTNGAYDGDQDAALAANAPVTAAVNDALLAAIETRIVADPELTIYWFDLDVQPVLDDPAAFGLDPDLLTTPFVDDLEAGRATLAEVDTYAFLDDVHVTAPVQDYLFGLALDALVFGGPDADTDNIVQGTALPERIDGYAGDDRLEGLAGADTLVGGAGDDIVFGGLGADMIYGDVI